MGIEAAWAGSPMTRHDPRGNEMTMARKVMFQTCLKQMEHNMWPVGVEPGNPFKGGSGSGCKTLTLECLYLWGGPQNGWLPFGLPSTPTKKGFPQKKEKNKHPLATVSVALPSSGEQHPRWHPQ